MIKLVSQFAEEPIADPNYIKIAASIKAYGTARTFCTVWRTGSTLICRTDGYMTIYGEDFESTELRNFINAVGARGFSCSRSAAEKLGYEHTVYNILKSTKGLAAPANFAPSCDEVYDILSLGTDGDITLPERTAFIADLSHRIRHDTAAACVYKGAVCVIPYMTDTGALICGVCAGENRGNGFAGMCVAAAIHNAKRPCFVLCSDKLLPFYTKFGFVKTGENAQIVF